MTVTSTPVWHDIFRKVTLKPDNITLEAERYDDTLTIVRGPGVNFGAANIGTDTFEINVDYNISVPVATTKLSLEDVNGNLSEITLTPGRGIAINRVSAQELEFESFSVTETDTLHTVTSRNNITTNKIFVNNIEVGTIASNTSEDGFTGYDGGHNLIGDGTLSNPMRFSPLYQDSLLANNTDQFEFVAVGPGTLAYAANYVFDTAATTGSVTLEREDPANPGNWTTLDTQSGNTAGTSYSIDGTYAELYSGSVTYRLTFAWTGNTGTATWFTNDTFEGGAYSPITAPQLKTDTTAKTVDINDIQFFQNTIRTTASNSDVVFDLAGTGQVRVLGNITADMLYGNVTGNLTGNADTVTNGVYTNGSYANPSWITSLDGTKVTNAVLTTGSYSDPTWITSLNASKIIGEINLSNITVDGTIRIYDNVIETAVSNADLELRANGTGVVSITDSASVSGTLTTTQLVANGASGLPALTTSATDISSAAWGANGINLRLPLRVYTDTTTPAGTLAGSFVNVIEGTIVDSTNLITITDLATLFVGAPNASGNSSATNKWAIYSGGWISAPNFAGPVGALGAASTGEFTTLSASQTVSLNPAGYNVTMSPTGAGTVTINPATAGTINNMSIGATTRAAGNFTTLNANGNVTLGDADTDTITVASSFVTGTVLRSAKSNGNTLNIAAYDVDGATYTNLITLTASNTPTLDLSSTGAMTISSAAVGSMNNINIGNATPGSGTFTILTGNGLTNNPSIQISSTALNSTAWTTSGIGLRINARTYTDTSSAAGTVASSYIHAIGTQTFASTNAITITDAASLFVAAPAAGTNSTLTNAWSIYAGGRIRATDFTGTIGATTRSAANFTNVDASGTLIVANTTYSYQPTPTSLTAANTLTAAQLLTGILINTAGSGNWQMPTGAQLDAALPATLPNDTAFDFVIITTGGAGPTVTTNTGITLIGTMSVGLGVSGRFTVRKTSASNYTVYRVA